MPTTRATDLIATIKSGPNRRIVLRPINYLPDRLGTFRDMWNLVAQIKVSIMGWDFPYVTPHDTKGQEKKFIWSATKFESILEYWELHKSGQFVFLTSFHELRPEVQSQLFAPIVEGNAKLNAVSQLYDFTETFEFTARYAKHSNLLEGLTIQICHTNMSDLVLGVSVSYAPIYSQRCLENEICLDRRLSYMDALTRNRPLAVEATEEFFGYFGASVRPDVLRKHQDTYYSERIGDDDLNKRYSAWPDGEG